MIVSKAVFCLLTFAALTHICKSSASKKNFTSLAEALEDVEKFILKLKKDSNVPAITFGLSVKGKTVYTKVSGYADLENEVPVTLSTRFRLASLSKSFTSALIGSLVDQGLIGSYNDSVHKYLKETDFPKKSWKGEPMTITLSHLLSHRAGTVRGDGFDTVVWANNVTECIHKRKEDALIFETGSAFSYSNYGFELLGAVIEAVTKKPYDVVMHQFMRSHGLNTTLVETMQSPLVLDRARYYREDNKDKSKNAPSPVSDELYMAEASWSDGNIISNIPEMLHYGRLLLNSYKGRQHGLVSQNTIKTMWTSHTDGLMDLEENIKASYGYAWFVYNNSTRNKELSFEADLSNYVSHSGGAGGLTSWINIYPEEEIVAVALTNKGDVLKLGETTTYAADAVAKFF